MSKIVLFYEKEGNFKGTVVNGHAFIFVSHVLSNFDYDEVCEFIDQGVKNNGYHWNAVKNEYEFWSAGKNSLKQGFDNLEQIKSFPCDGMFQVDLERTLIQI